jgi:hypothetical protein
MIAMTADRTEARRALNGAIIAWLVERYGRACRDPDAPSSAAVEAVSYYAMDSDAEAIVLALHGIGLIAPVGAGQERYQGVSGPFRFTILPDACSDIARERFDDGENYAAALRALVKRAVYHDQLSIDHEPFSVDQALTPILDALCDAGFAAREGHRYRWNDAITPTMIALRLWNEAGRSAADARRDALLTMAQAVPQAVHGRVAALVLAGDLVDASVTLRDAMGWSLSQAIEVVGALHPESRKRDRHT